MDSEGSYAVNFMDYVSRRRTAPFEVHAFTNLDRLEDYLKKRRAEVLLISEKDLDDRVPELVIPNVIILTERPVSEYGASGLTEFGRRHMTEETGDGPGASSNSKYPGSRENGARWRKIYKYQAVSVLMRLVMDICLEADSEAIFDEDGIVFKKGMRTIGVFSPIGRTMKTSFAAALGQCLARRRPTLFMSLDACTGFSTLMHTEYDRNLSDAIYYIRQGETHVSEKILPMIREIGQMSYLPPFSRAQELYSVTAEEWSTLIAHIRQESGFEALVLDLGEIPLIHPSLLEECDRIYMPVRSDPQARSKLSEFGQVMKEAALEPVGARIRRMKLAPGNMPESMDRWFETLPYSGLGKAAEECIARDHLDRL